jgi:hypothetical protein
MKQVELETAFEAKKSDVEATVATATATADSQTQTATPSGGLSEGMITFLEISGVIVLIIVVGSLAVKYNINI